MDDSILDLAEFKDRVQDDTELLLELLDIFVDDFRVKRALMDEAVANKNSEELRSLVHSLKGASGNISAKSMRATLAKIEEVSKNNETEGLEGIFKTLDHQFADLLVCIDQVKSEIGG